MKIFRQQVYRTSSFLQVIVEHTGYFMKKEGTKRPHQLRGKSKKSEQLLGPRFIIY